ncbi:MAG: lysophospholipase [Clostridiales bacterium]|jgi:pimeloyl-ACP methyl ester carboxylesterase|nr:lysophospholipase [Clostridiales bacterium]
MPSWGIILIVVGSLAVLFSSLILVTAYNVHRAFGRRESFPGYRLEEFPGLFAEAKPFPNYRGERLSGYVYSRAGVAVKGLHVFCHGKGSVHRDYLYYIDALCKGGYLVFAYDNTGYGESGGACPGSLEQAVLDLGSALRYVKSDSALSGYKISLSGHSWGGYAVTARLNSPGCRIEAAVDIAGFNSISGFMAVRQGKAAFLLYLPMLTFSFFKRGRISGYSAVGGIKKARDTRVLMLYSRDDKEVPYSIYRRMLRKLQAARNVRFVFFDDRGHNPFFSGARSAVMREATDKHKRALAAADEPSRGLLRAGFKKEIMELQRGWEPDFIDTVLEFLG